MTTITTPLPVLDREKSSIARTDRGRAFATLARRRMLLSAHTPREIVVPLLTPILFACVIAPALATSMSSSSGIDYLSFVAVGTVGLLVPLSCILGGIGMLVERESGAQRDLLGAPIPLPLTHALALMRYGLVDRRGTGLHDIWGMHSNTAMAGLSLAVVVAFALVMIAVSVRVFTRSAVR